MAPGIAEFGTFLAHKGYSVEHESCAYDSIGYLPGFWPVSCIAFLFY
jgi:hypothetical protein